MRFVCSWCRHLEHRAGLAQKRDHALRVVPRGALLVFFSCVYNSELLTAYRYWLYGWDWGNLAVILGDHFDHIECSSRALGVDVQGWHCIFQQMPRICTFRTMKVRLLPSIGSIGGGDAKTLPTLGLSLLRYSRHVATRNHKSFERRRKHPSANG